MLAGQGHAVDERQTLESFRDAMRLHAAGVCVISIGEGEAVNGMAATAVTSFSMDPPSILVCVNRSASIAPDLTEGGAFGLAVLARRHRDVVAAFSRKPTGWRRFDHGSWILETGCKPFLADAVANLDCVVERTAAYGSHRAVIGRVVDARVGPTSDSLV